MIWRCEKLLTWGINADLVRLWHVDEEVEHYGRPRGGFGPVDDEAREWVKNEENKPFLNTDLTYLILTKKEINTRYELGYDESKLAPIKSKTLIAEAQEKVDGN